jgi:hypothetical protein
MTVSERFPRFKSVGPVVTNGLVCVERTGLNYRVYGSAMPNNSTVLLRNCKIRQFRSLETAMAAARRMERTLNNLDSYAAFMEQLV